MSIADDRSAAASRRRARTPAWPDSSSRAGRRTQRERSAEAQEKLLNAAITLICERGFALTTMADIAATAGMTRGAIQHHFEGRTELVLAILKRLEGRIVDTFDSVSTGGVSGVGDRIERLIDALGAVAQSQSFLAVVDIWVSARADVDLRDGVHDSMARAGAYYRQLWQRTFAEELSASVISECRRIVVNVMRGTVVSRILEGGRQSSAATIATCKKMVRQYVEAAAGRGGYARPAP